MIWVDNKFFPLAGRGESFINSVFISPWTGQVWARIDRDPEFEWFGVRMAAAGEKPWPLPESIPGSLYSDYDEWRWQATRELPRPLLLREVKLLERWTSATLSGYNCPTIPTEASVNQSLMQEIAALRAKEAAGTLSDDELRAVLRKMREGRVTAAVTSAKSRTKAVAVDPDAALAEFLS